MFIHRINEYLVLEFRSFFLLLLFIITLWYKKVMFEYILNRYRYLYFLIYFIFYASRILLLLVHNTSCIVYYMLLHIIILYITCISHIIWETCEGISGENGVAYAKKASDGECRWKRNQIYASNYSVCLVNHGSTLNT